METFLKQMRVRFSGLEEDNKEGSQRIPSQKSQSFKDTKRSSSWLERQFSRKMSRDYDFKEGNIDYAAAVAAAAFAITSVEDSIRDQRRGFGPEKNVTIRTTTSVTDTGKSITPTSSIKKKPIFKNTTDGVASTKPEVETPEKIEMPSAQSFRKTPTFGDQLLDRRSRKSLSQPSTPREPSPTKDVIGGTRADVWEREEMEKIKARYEKLNSTILEWEAKKKKKAKSKLEKIEADLATKRAKALEHFRNEIERIDSISGGAKTQAQQNRQNEELKVKEKANKYRYTGNLPASCWCF